MLCCDGPKLPVYHVEAELSKEFPYRRNRILLEDPKGGGPALPSYQEFAEELLYGAGGQRQARMSKAATGSGLSEC